MLLPDELVRNVTHVLGDEGQRWLDELPALLDACAQDFGLTIGEPFELSFNYVAPVTRADGSEAVLKLSPHGQDFRYEVAATRLFDGRGMAHLLESDDDRGLALIERLRPGGMLVELDDDDQRTEIAADVMLALRRPAPEGHGLPSALDWFSAFAKHRAEHGGGSGPLPPDLFERGEAIYEELLRSSGPPVLLHGDLHHYNILSAERSPWLAIDPHGLVGDAAFEVGAFLGNPSGIAALPDLARVLKRRCDILAERLGFDRGRVVAWGCAYQMLSAVWSCENNGTGWRHAATVSAALASML